MRVVILQYTPIFKDSAATVIKVNEIIDGSAVTGADIIVLPELSFCGYTFADYADAYPHAEVLAGSPTCAWASALSQRMRAFTFVSFLELDDAKLYITLAVHDRTGRLVGTRRKYNLFGNELKFITPGAHPYTKLPLEGIGNVGLVICNDINPVGYPNIKSDNGKFTEYMRGIDFLIYAADVPRYRQVGQAAALHKHWKTRVPAGAIFVGASRVGKENGVEFAGSSCIIKNNNVVAMADDVSECAIIADV